MYALVKNNATIVLKTVQNVYLGAKNEKTEGKIVIFDMEIAKIRGSWLTLWLNTKQMTVVSIWHVW